MPDQKEIEIRYKLVSVEQETFSVPTKPENYEVSIGDILFNITVGVKIVYDKNQIWIGVKVVYLSKSLSTMLMEIQTRSTFYVVNHEEVFKPNDTTTILPDNLLLDLFNISVHTTNGIILARVENTYLKGMILGAFSPYRILEGMKAREAENKKSVD